ncbi:MAG: aldolase catalytic domain-containing protein [Candidatus Methylomirabilales bacterium]
MRHRNHSSNDVTTLGLEILDCTLRDGGYYNNWDFDDTTVERYLDGVVSSGIHYVEIGFRSKSKQGFAGKYKFCKDGHLRGLFANRPVGVAVMIDGKDFIRSSGDIDREGLLELFRPKPESPVDLVRITTTQATLPAVLRIGGLIKDLGYLVSINVMRASMLSESHLAETARTADRSQVDILYIADSFGGLTPDETRKLFVVIRENFSRRMAFHAHDNLGFALSNTLAAIDGGAEMVDCSLLGMGRGAGNLRTEQFLLYLRSKCGRSGVDPAPLFEVASTDFARLQKHYQWGTSLPYMLSGVYSVHPMYAQQLLQVHRYSPLEVVRVLEALHASGASASFSAKRLSDALQERFSTVRDRVFVNHLEGYRPGLPGVGAGKERCVLLLGSGPSVRNRSEDIKEFIRIHQPVVIECNVQKEIDPGAEQYSLFTNYWRLEEHIHHLVGKRRRAVLGMSEVSSEMARFLERMEIYHYPYRVAEGQFQVAADGCVIPYDVVAMFAFAFALRAGAKSIFLCGFDGYLVDLNEDKATQVAEKMVMQREMEEFFRLLRDHEEVTRQGVRVVSLTPAAYEIEQESLYAYI